VRRAGSAPPADQRARRSPARAGRGVGTGWQRISGRRAAMRIFRSPDHRCARAIRERSCSTSQVTDCRAAKQPLWATGNAHRVERTQRAPVPALEVHQGACANENWAARTAKGGLSSAARTTGLVDGQDCIGPDRHPTQKTTYRPCQMRTGRARQMEGEGRNDQNGMSIVCESECFGSAVGSPLQRAQPSGLSRTAGAARCRFHRRRQTTLLRVRIPPADERLR
jgi:hypothetical protein